MRIWRPPLNFRALLAPTATLASLLGAILLAMQLLQRGSRRGDAGTLDLTLFMLALSCLLLLGLAVVFALKAIRRLTLSFRGDRDAVTAQWWGGRCVIPLDALATGAAEDPHLPEIRFGSGTRNQIVVLQTPRARYALVVSDPESFMGQIGALIALGVVRPRAEGFQFDYARLRAFGADPLVRRALLLCGASNLLLWAFLSWRYQSLPETIVTHFDPLGGPAGIRARSYTLTLMGASSLMAALDSVGAAWLHGRARVASQLLLLAALLVQLLMAVALTLLLFPQR